MTLATRLPWTHPFSGGYPRLGGQALPTDPDAIDYLERVAAADGAAVEVGVAMAVDQFIKGCKADYAGYAGDPTRTVWDALQACCIMAGARTISGALVPLVGDAPTPYNFVTGDYNRTTGLRDPDATSYLDSGRANDADAQNDKHVSVYATANSYTTIRAYYGGGLNVSGSENAYDASPTSQGFRSQSSSAKSFTVTPTTGLVGTSRSSSSEFTARTAGNSTVLSSGSQAPSADTLFIFSLNQAGAPSFTKDCTLAFYSIGSALNLAALDARVTTLVASIAAALS